ncbi:MAG: hypothetical protein K2P94_10770 [Rhodospirillaceae bacterium]|nr:hypothetical protein [Rhodospirillaceae bacterium]
MQRTEQSVGRTSPKGQISSRPNGGGGSTEEFEIEASTLEDLAQAYGARLPESVVPPLFHVRFSDHPRGVTAAPLILQV